MKLHLASTSTLITFISTIHCILGASQSLSACFSSSQKSLSIQCGYGNMVRILRTFYGHAEKIEGQADRCYYEPGDCKYEEHDSYSCVGRDSCNINLPTGGYGRQIPQCNKASNYFQVDYECVPVTNTYDICKYQELTNEWGYIASPNYPNVYNNSQHCQLKIKVSPGQKIKLYVIDMDIEMSATDNCPDWFYAHDNHLSVTLCGKRSNEGLKQSMQNEFHLQFVSNSIINHKGFWLYYEAFPPAYSTTTIKSTTTRKRIPTTTKRVTQWQRPSPTNVPVTKITKHIHIAQKEEIPFAAIVGGVIGTLSLILVILLVLLAIKWWKEKRRKQDKSRFIEVQNPGYRNSNEFRNTGAEMCYNYIDC